MLRIMLSRAALFPWLGLALMAAGAIVPEGNVAGPVLIVVGANLAFYSLRDFSQNFAWGQGARPMLRLCGLAFLLGLALMVWATQFDSLNHWVALLAAGLYLCLFAVWNVQQPVGGAYRLLAFVGVLLMFAGGMFGSLVWHDWRVFAESEPVDQEITLEDLLANGFGNNRHVRLTRFRFCDREAEDKPGKHVKTREHWIPVVPIDGRDVKQAGLPPPVPPRVKAVAAYLTLGRPVGGQQMEARLRRAREEAGYEGTVVTGIKKLKPEVRQQLLELGPQTDLDDVVVLHWGSPGSPERVYGFLAVGGAGLLLGLLCLGVVYLRAWRVVVVHGWPPLHSEPDDGGKEEQAESPAGMVD
jgi:8-oxo-dGTP pyrophosphatase MutT (NUDIX family)